MPAPTSGAGGKFTVARITVALGDLVPLIDEWAARKGTQRPDAVRRLLAIALGVDPPPTRRNRPAPPRNELAAAYAESGLRGVGKRYGAAADTVRRWLDEHGIPHRPAGGQRPKKIPPEHVPWVRELLATGRTHEEIARLYRCHPQTVSVALRRERQRPSGGDRA